MFAACFGFRHIPPAGFRFGVGEMNRRRTRVRHQLLDLHDQTAIPRGSNTIPTRGPGGVLFPRIEMVFKQLHDR